MQIEETFRDEKNHRFGWSLRHVRSQFERRLEVLLLLAALATLAVTLVGLGVERAGIHRRYQANTVRHRVLSLFVLGNLVLRRKEPLPAAFLRSGLQHFRQYLRALVTVGDGIARP